uniref:Uncharacterized protein n=1 Tax=Arundo donax TaxID=35708 RepID=A0A0A9EFV6_ARUDO
MILNCPKKDTFKMVRRQACNTNLNQHQMWSMCPEIINSKQNFLRLCKHRRNRSKSL